MDESRSSAFKFNGNSTSKFQVCVIELCFADHLQTDAIVDAVLSQYKSVQRWLLLPAGLVIVSCEPMSRR